MTLSNMANAIMKNLTRLWVLQNNCNWHFLFFLSAIVSSDPAVEVDPEVEIENEVNPRATCGVYFLLCMVGMSANLASNTLWVQLPILIAKLPEGHDLPLYLLVLWELGNLSALVYLLARKCSRTGTSDAAPIYTCIFLNIATVALLGFFWDRQVYLFEESHSLTVILCMVVMGKYHLRPLLLTWIKFNPSMDK